MSNKFKTKNVYKTIIQNCVLIIGFTVVFGAFGYFYAQHKQSTVYKTTQNVIINHSYNGESASDEVQADLSLTKTYQEVIKSNDIVRKAKEYLPNKLQKKYSVNDIAKMTSAQAIPSTTMIEISASSASANTSAQLANAVVRAAEKEVPSKIPSGSIKSVSNSSKSDAKSITSPSRKKYTILGLAVGFLIGMVISFSITTWTKLI